MPLQIDATDKGLSAGPAASSATQNALPNAQTVEDRGRWGFVVDDTTSVSVPKEQLNNVFFSQDEFNVTFSFAATDGASSAGEIFRIHNSLMLLVDSSGQFRLDFINSQGTVKTLWSNATFALDGHWHDITISYSDADGAIQFFYDNELLMQGSASGSTRPQQFWGLNFGPAFGSTGFDGLIDDVFINNAASTPAAPAAAAGALVETQDFNTWPPSSDYTVYGNASVSPLGSLVLDGANDYITFDAPSSWDGTGIVNLELDFRFSNPANVTTVIIAHVPNVYTIAVNGTAAILTVHTQAGPQYLWAGELSFNDLNWHTAALLLDTNANTVTLHVDGVKVLDRSDMDLQATSTFGQTWFGGNTYAGWIEGEIDNIVYSPLADTGPAPSGVSVNLDFNNSVVPPSLTVFGDTHINAFQSLDFDGAGDYAELALGGDWDNTTVLTVDFDFRFNDPNQLTGSRVIYADNAFGITASGSSIVLIVETASGSEFLWAGNLSLSDLQWHHVSLEIDTTADTVQLSIDGDLKIDRSGLNLSLPNSLSKLELGGAAWGNYLKGELDNLLVTSDAMPVVDPSGNLGIPYSLDFGSQSVPAGVSLFGDAIISAGGTLQLDGNGDYVSAVLPSGWDGADNVNVIFDFRFSNPADLDSARLVSETSAFGLTATGTSLTLSVETDVGTRWLWAGNQPFSDLQWYSIEFNINSTANTVSLKVDDQIAVARSDLDIVLPTALDALTIGGANWGAGLAGEIDNLSVTADNAAPAANPEPDPVQSVIMDFETGVPNGFAFKGNAAAAGGVLSLDGAGDYAVYDIPSTFDQTSVLTVELDFRFSDANQLGQSILMHNGSTFSLNTSGSALTLSVATASGNEYIWLGNQSFHDLAWHSLDLSIDENTNRLVFKIDGNVLVDRSDLDLVLPSTFDPVFIGGAAWGNHLAGEIDNVHLGSDVVPSTTTGANLGTPYILDFNSALPQEVNLLANAAVVNGALDLDGTGDRAVLDFPNGWEGANKLDISIDLRFDDPGSLGNSRILYEDNAFGIIASGNSMVIMVQTTTGSQHLWSGNLPFHDLQWHTIDVSIDTLTKQVTADVDGQNVLTRNNIDLVLPSELANIDIGGAHWGDEVSGQIDNISITPSANTTIQSAIGNADPTVALNTAGVPKWDMYSQAMFIDRMKGAHEWNGQYAAPISTIGSHFVFDSANVFTGGPPIDLAFTAQTVVNISQFVTKARFSLGLIDHPTYLDILAKPNDYFKIEIGASGNSELLGRLDTSDPFSVMVRFDQDIGTDLNGLRATNQMFAVLNDHASAYSEIVLDENGWPVQLPTDPSGADGKVSSIVLWYSQESAQQADSIYSGPFNLIVEGEGTISLIQSGTGPGRINLQDIQIDGPTIIPFDYAPNGKQVTFTISESDPNDNGEYIRNVKIVHDDHMDLFEAGEIFTPEFTALHEDNRIVRWMNAQETVHSPDYAAGDFADAPTYDYYTFTLGTSATNENGVPIDAIIAFSNKTGTDPWINVPVNSSDAYVQGLASYIEANLDPRLQAYVEFGNENWNFIFDTYIHSTNEGMNRWGALQLAVDPNTGLFERDGNGDLIVLSHGRFFWANDAVLAPNGFASLDELETELGLTYQLQSRFQAWAEWTSMRATEVAKIFNDTFEAADPTGADARLNTVMGTFSIDPLSTQRLMTGSLWQEEEPGNWIDPASQFDSLAVAAYFGHTVGGKDSDIVDYWLGLLGAQQTQDLFLRHLKAGSDPSIDLIQFDKSLIKLNGTVDSSKVVTGVQYNSDLAIDLFDAIYDNNGDIRNKILNGHGITQGIEVLFGSDVHNYARLITTAGNNTAIQLRVDPLNGTFETVLEFNGIVNKTIEELIHEGTLFVRAIQSMQDSFEIGAAAQKPYADTYGLDMIAYEGGQHVSASVAGIYSVNLGNSALTSFYAQVNDSPEMADLYAIWHDTWIATGGGPFVHFHDYGIKSKYGSFGLIEYLGQEDDPSAVLHRYNAVNDLNNAPPWWQETRDADAFLQGRTITGTANEDTLAGTVEEDIIIAGAGDDLLIGGPGDDGLSAGTGNNTIDAGDGDDIIVLSNTTDTVFGGAGFDTIKMANSLASMELVLLNASSVEAIDTRNNATSTLIAPLVDVFAFSATNNLTIYAETADTIDLTGFTYQGSTDHIGQSSHAFSAIHFGQAVNVTVWTNTDSQPDIIL